MDILPIAQGTSRRILSSNRYVQTANNAITRLCNQLGNEVKVRNSQTRKGDRDDNNQNKQLLGLSIICSPKGKVKKNVVFLTDHKYPIYTILEAKSIGNTNFENVLQILE